MGTKLTHTCDKCGHTQETSAEGMWRAGLKFSGGTINGIFPQTHFGHKVAKIASALFCESCMGVLGLRPYAETDKKAEPPKPPTIEDMIYEIVDEAIDNRN